MTAIVPLARHVAAANALTLAESLILVLKTPSVKLSVIQLIASVHQACLETHTVAVIQVRYYSLL